MPTRALHEHAADRRLVARGTAWSALAWAIALVTGPVLTIVFARTMSREQFGLLGVASAISVPASALATLGLGPAVTQLASSSAATAGNEGVLAAFRVAFRLALRALPWIVLAAVGLVAGVHSIGSVSSATSVVAVMLPAIIVAPLASTFDGILRATAQPAWAAGAAATGSVLGAVAAIAVLPFVSTTSAALPVAAARTSGPVLAAGVLLVAVLRWKSRLAAVPDISIPFPARQVLTFSGAMLLTSFGWLLISQLDIFFLGVWKGPGAAGRYVPASRLADMAIALVAVGGSFLLPVLSRAIADDDPRKAASLYHWASRWAFVAGAPVAAMLIVTPGPLLRILFGSAFDVSAQPARILGLGVLVQMVGGFNGLALEAHGVPRLSAIRAAAGIVVTVGLCIALIPAYGATGAAWATTAAIAVINITSSGTLARRFAMPPWDVPFMATLLGFATAIGLSVAASRGLSDDVLRCGVTAVVTLAITFGVSWRSPTRTALSGSIGAGTADDGKERAREDQQVQ